MKNHLLLFALFATTSAFFWYPARFGSDRVLIKDPKAILDYHLRTLQYVVANRNTSLLVRMMPEGEYSEEDVSGMFQFASGFRAKVLSAEHGERGEIEGTVVFRKGSRRMTAVVTIENNPVSPTYWQLLHVVFVGEEKPFIPCAYGKMVCELLA